ncbi:unnamed protein product [Periconia digitata]|uniref:RRM domain-containing protein n=1 Tax=Periconia digitata TaxID=1303443 RepID=A0A9W4XSM4_9PLEO|nr:unnamed protein product [Periconia digitata]
MATSTSTSTPAPPSTSRLKATVFVGGLDNAVTQQTLYHAFLPFGDIVDVNLPKTDNNSSNNNSSNSNASGGGGKKGDGAHKGFGYVEFESAGDAADAIDNMDRSELYGQVIKVAPAKPQKEHGEGLGSKTAVWEQEGWIAKHAVSEEDRQATQQQTEQAPSDGPMDPMQGLEGLDEAGPKQA